MNMQNKLNILNLVQKDGRIVFFFFLDLDYLISIISSFVKS
jgi:hypothetical protein